MKMRTIGRWAFSLFAVYMIVMLTPLFYLSVNVPVEGVLGLPMFAIFVLAVTLLMILTLVALYVLEGKDKDVPF